MPGVVAVSPDWVGDDEHLIEQLREQISRDDPDLSPPGVLPAGRPWTWRRRCRVVLTSRPALLVAALVVVLAGAVVLAALLWR